MNAVKSPRPFRCLRFRGGKRGFSLVEVVLSLGIVTFVSVTLVALIPVGLSANKASREQITALNYCRNIESDLKATPASASKSPLYGIDISAAAGVTTLYDNVYTTSGSGMGNFSTTAQSTSQYRFTITPITPPATSPNDPVNVRIQATWPATIVPATPAAGQINPPNVVGTVNLDVAVNRFGS